MEDLFVAHFQFEDAKRCFGRKRKREKDTLKELWSQRTKRPTEQALHVEGPTYLTYYTNLSVSIADLKGKKKNKEEQRTAQASNEKHSCLID